MGSLPIGISGSRAAAILGMSPWATPFSVWQDIMEKRTPGFNEARGFDYEPFDGNASTRWGLAFEDAIIKLAEERAETYITDREEEYKVQGFEYVTCHIDGKYGPKVYTVDEVNCAPRVLHEGKTTTAYGLSKWGEPGTDKIPIEYQVQVQHQMLCTGADSAIVSVLVFPKRPDDWEAEGWSFDGVGSGLPVAMFKGEDYVCGTSLWANTLAQMGFFHQYTVAANRDLQQLMLDKYREWWTKYVLGETPPDPADYSDIRAMITAPVGTIIVDDDTARWFKEYKSIGAEIGTGGNLAKRRDQLKVLILKRGYIREHQLCPHDRTLKYSTCHGECGQPECTIGQAVPVLDDESTNKWVFRDDKGDKLGSYGRTKAGNMVFR